MFPLTSQREIANKSSVSISCFWHLQGLSTSPYVTMAISTFNLSVPRIEGGFCFPQLSLPQQGPACALEKNVMLTVTISFLRVLPLQCWLPCSHLHRFLFINSAGAMKGLGQYFLQHCGKKC